ncbi:hypothetical protein Tco_0412123 [Tanacetum coccineum]
MLQFEGTEEVHEGTAQVNESTAEVNESTSEKIKVPLVFVKVPLVLSDISELEFHRENDHVIVQDIRHKKGDSTFFHQLRYTRFSSSVITTRAYRVRDLRDGEDNISTSGEALAL